MTSLYEAIKAAGIEISSHESDLYFPATEKSRAILRQFPLSRRNASTFTNQGSGTPGNWFDVPFAFMPYWDRKAK